MKAYLSSFILLAASVVMLSGCATATLHQAVMNDDLNQATRLIQSGADVNGLDSDNIPPICYAVLREKSDHSIIRAPNPEVMQLLLDKGARVNSSCLKIASSDQKIISEKFKEMGIHLDLSKVKDISNHTALHVASEQGFTKITKLLIEKGADVNVQDSGGWTPLMFAYLNGHVEIANLLIQNGANTKLRNKQNQTSSDILKKYQHDQNIYSEYANERKRKEAAESKEMWGAIGTLATGVAVGNATRNLAPDQQTRMMESSMKSVQSGDASELTNTTNQVKAEQAQSHKEKMHEIEEQKEHDRAAKEQKSNSKVSSNGTSKRKSTSSGGMNGDSENNPSNPDFKPVQEQQRERCVSESKCSSRNYATEEEARKEALRYCKFGGASIGNESFISTTATCTQKEDGFRCTAITKFERDAPCGSTRASEGRSK